MISELLLPRQATAMAESEWESEWNQEASRNLETTMKEAFDRFLKEMREFVEEIRKELKDSFEEMRRDLKESFNQLREDTKFMDDDILDETEIPALQVFDQMPSVECTMDSITPTVVVDSFDDKEVEDVQFLCNPTLISSHADFCHVFDAEVNPEPSLKEDSCVGFLLAQQKKSREEMVQREFLEFAVCAVNGEFLLAVHGDIECIIGIRSHWLVWRDHFAKGMLDQMLVVDVVVAVDEYDKAHQQDLLKSQEDNGSSDCKSDILCSKVCFAKNDTKCGGISIEDDIIQSIHRNSGGLLVSIGPVQNVNCDILMLARPTTCQYAEKDISTGGSSYKDPTISAEEIKVTIQRTGEFTSQDQHKITNDMVDGDEFFPDAELGMDTCENLSESTEIILNSEDTSKTAQQVVMVGCWLAMKEASLLLGAIIRKILLSSCIDTDLPKLVCSASRTGEAETMIMIEGMFDLQQLEIVDSQFLQVLFKMKHNGAFDKTRVGLFVLCNRLLCSNDPRLCNLTESWMEQLMERTIAKGQIVDDLLRGSVGIPAAFIASFIAELEGTPKKLLSRVLRWLIDIANTSLCNRHQAGNYKSEMMNANLFNDLNEAEPETIMTGRYKNGVTSKIRDEGVIPTVHAFNVLRAAFNDTNLTADTPDLSAEALIVSICSFSSPYCEVWNNDCLAYTVLVLASKALTGLVSNERLHIVLNDVANTIPPERHHIAISKGLHLGSSVSVNNSNGNEPTSVHSVSFNHVHGVLLQMPSFLNSNCMNLSDGTKKEQTIGDLNKVLLKCSWIGSSKSCPCPTLNSSYLQFLDQMLSIAITYTGQHVSAIQNLTGDGFIMLGQWKILWVAIS